MFQQIKINQLDRRFNKKVLLREVENPREGWIKEIRKALMMTYSQLGKKLSVTPAAIQRFEKNEMEGSINLNSLNKIATALNCKLIYAIVPNESLEKTIDSQIDKVVRQVVSKIDHSMSLEKQNINKIYLKEQINALKRNLKNNLSNKLWNYEI
jgi:predicted DNA-binding mobile mystery protein A